MGTDLPQQTGAQKNGGHFIGITDQRCGLISFKDLVETNTVDTASELSMSCLWFCFKDILRADLDHVRDHWNTYYIRKSRQDTVPGRPDELFYLPKNSGFEDFRCSITEQRLDDMAVYCTTDEKENIFRSILIMRWSPTSWREALTLFQRLSASITIGHSKTFLYNPMVLW